MPLSFYAPTGKISGGCVFITHDLNTEAIYFKMCKQIANNPDKKGNFDGKNPYNIKFNIDECGGIIRAIREKGAASFFHKFEEDTTAISAKYFTFDTEKGKKEGFTITASKNKVPITVSLTLDAAETLSLYLQKAMGNIFNKIDADHAKQHAEYKARTGYQPKASPTPAAVETDDVSF